jgi:hypothetical protein
VDYRAYLGTAFIASAYLLADQAIFTMVPTFRRKFKV